MRGSKLREERPEVSGGKWRAAEPTTRLPSLAGDHSVPRPSRQLTPSNAPAP